MGKSHDLHTSFSQCSQQRKTRNMDLESAGGLPSKFYALEMFPFSPLVFRLFCGQYNNWKRHLSQWQEEHGCPSDSPKIAGRSSPKTLRVSSEALGGARKLHRTRSSSTSLPDSPPKAPLEIFRLGQLPTMWLVCCQTLLLPRLDCTYWLFIKWRWLGYSPQTHPLLRMGNLSLWKGL